MAPGGVPTATSGDTRTQADFVNHIRGLVVAHPEVSQWLFVVDNLNIHLSESLVGLVAEESAVAIDLGKKRYKGILKD